MPSKGAEAFLKALVDEFRKERGKRNLSQEHLASKSGVDRGTISRLERLERIPSILALYDLAAALDLPLHRLIERATKQMPKEDGG
ncbi:helix-turn-helix transcriptional regulator [Luteolibacter sp. Populi]|uniref:helix-turn-helix transcriptional regulator n=1 Tax=Luteolibacter sp. Populi TaxID=3230487 RepID=UPI003465D675